MSDKVNTGNNMEDKKLIKNARKPSSGADSRLAYTNLKMFLGNSVNN